MLETTTFQKILNNITEDVNTFETDIIYLHGSESKFGVYTCNHAASHLSTSGGNAAWNLELSNSYRASC